MKEQRGPTNDGQGGIQHFGNYDLVRRIDVGGMGEVYLARQRTAFGREVAVKIIRSDLVHDVTARKRFLREAEVSAYIKHDHILPLVEFGEEQGRLFLVTPYIEGGNLGARLQHGALPISEIHHLFTALVQAVSYLHKRGVVHRDLKPSNILLDRQEDTGQVYVRLIDFGIATLQGLSASAPLTTAGQEMGTVAYMAPERANGIAAPSNDLYSLGIILYQMLTGQLPAGVNSASIPQPLEQVVRYCVAPDPAQRFANADDLLQAFEQAFRSLTSPRLQVVTSLPAVPPLADGASDYDDLAAVSIIARPTPAPPSRSRPPLSRPIQPGPEDEDMTIIAPASSKPAHAALPAVVQQPTPRFSLFPDNRTSFSGDDYNAQTSSLDPAYLNSIQPVAPSRLPRRRPPRQKPHRSFVALITALTLVIIFVLSGLAYLVFQSAISASIGISPHVQAISSVFTLTARPGQNIKPDVNASLIPAYVLNNSKTGTQQAAATGASGCVLGIFECKQTVSIEDISVLADHIRSGMKTQIDQDLHKQAADKGYTPVGNTVYQDASVNAVPALGTVSKTVSVTLTEQGSIECVKAQDAHDMAISLLKHKLDNNYVLIDSITQIGLPVIQKVNANGDVTVAIAVGGVERYQLSQSELKNIQNHLKGMTQQQARAFIGKQPNLEPAATTIHITYGGTIPTNTQQIKLIITNPTNYPAVQLPAMPTPVATATPPA